MSAKQLLHISTSIGTLKQAELPLKVDCENIDPGIVYSTSIELLLITLNDCTILFADSIAISVVKFELFRFRCVFEAC